VSKETGGKLSDKHHYAHHSRRVKTSNKKEMYVSRKFEEFYYPSLDRSTKINIIYTILKFEG
jgi:hypothetical protein